VGAGAEAMVNRGNGQRAVVKDGRCGDAGGRGQRAGDGENDKGTRWKIQTVVMIKSGRLTGRGWRKRKRPTLKPDGGGTKY
jgi:hypothetical protein